MYYSALATPTPGEDTATVRRIKHISVEMKEHADASIPFPLPSTLATAPQLSPALLSSPLMAPLLLSAQSNDPFIKQLLTTLVGPGRRYVSEQAFWNDYLTRFFNIVASSVSPPAAASLHGAAAAVTSPTKNIKAPTEPEPEKEAQEQTLLLTLREVFCYKLPPRASAMGYKAADWGLESPLLTGYIRVVAVGDEEIVVAVWQRPEQMLKPATAPTNTTAPAVDKVTVLTAPSLQGHKLVAACQMGLQTGVFSADKLLIQPLEWFLEPVADSSRYFVMRVYGASTSKGGKPVPVGTLGIGFADRQAAFDLRSSITDYLSFTSRQRGWKEPTTDISGSSGSTATMEDSKEEGSFALEPGQKITITLNLKSSSAQKQQSSISTTSMLGSNTTSMDATTSGIPRLLGPPPPPPGHTTTATTAAQGGGNTSNVQASSSGGNDGVGGAPEDDNEWGEFEGAAT
jgi:hypothetical protein